MAVQKVFKWISGHGPTITWNVDDRNTSSVTAAMAPGEPLKISGNFVIPLATGDPEAGTDEFVGLVRKTSTESATVDGVVEVVGSIPGLSIFRGFATTAANIDTAAELAVVINEWVACDLTALTGTNGDFTIDEDETSSAKIRGFKIVRGNTLKGTLDCLVHSAASQAGPQTSA